MSPLPIRLLVLASDLLARTGLAGLLGSEPNLNIIAQAAPGDDLETLLAVYRPQIVLWDMAWASDVDLALLADWLQPDGTLGTSLLTQPARLVALAAHETGARFAWDAGARAILFRSAPLPRLLTAIIAAAEGLIVVDDQLLPLLGRLSPAEGRPLDEPLTPRELDVLQLLAQGLANKTIARRLEISEHTVKFHVNSILTKLGAQSRTDAVVRASRAGLVLL